MLKISKHCEVNKLAKKLYSALPNADFDQFVITGEQINLAENSLTGHGIMEENGKYYASICGYVKTTNQLTYLEGLHSQYYPAAGDVIIGRISDVDIGHWSVDIGSNYNAKLTPQCLALESGEQRCKTSEELIDLRRFFKESDIIFTEVQKAYPDGNCNLHTRSAKYGKLRSGFLVSVPAELICRLTSHICLIDDIIQLIIGTNGFIWIGAPYIDDIKVSSNYTDVSGQKICDLTDRHIYAGSRVRNCIIAMAELKIVMLPEIIERMYHTSIKMEINSYEILNPINYLGILEVSLR